jgi:hypothetical protein
MLLREDVEEKPVVLNEQMLDARIEDGSVPRT